MPLDFRYHLASLTAVFGALIIGILVGVAMKEGPALSGQVEDLRRDFHRYDSIHNIDQRTDLFNARIQGAVVRNRLFGRNIALVCNPLTTSADELPAVRRTLEDAGATVTTEILLKPALEQVTPQQLQKVTQQAAFPNMATQITTDDLLNRLAAAIGSSTAAIIPVLQQTNLLKVNGDPTKPISAIVYLGGIDDAGKYLNDIDIPFLHGCTQRGITVAATECVESEQSAMAEYKKVAPITIDNIDRAAGRIAMVLALSTGQHGNYGYKDTAEDVVPDCE